MEQAVYVCSIKHNIMKKFNGLAKASEDFVPFVVVNAIQDPGYGYGYVYLMLIQFEDMKMGLCIYSVESEKFISEPGELLDYNFESLEDVYRKYPRLEKKTYVRSIKDLNKKINERFEHMQLAKGEGGYYYYLYSEHKETALFLASLPQTGIYGMGCIKYTSVERWIQEIENLLIEAETETIVNYINKKNA